MTRVERWAPWVPPLFVVGLFLPSLLQPGILHPPLPHLNDATRQILLWREFWRDEVLAGSLPLWDPFLFLGVPFIGEIQSAVFYPLNLLFLALPSDFAFKTHLLLSLLVAALFFYRLCRSLGASREGAALGALAFAANGQLILFAFGGWLNHLSVAGWTPAVLWAFLEAQRGGRRRRVRYLILGAGFLTLQSLGGHPEWMFYTLVAAMAVAVGRSGESRAGGLAVAAGRPWLSLGAMIALAGLLSGPQLLPAIEAVLQSSRGQDALSRVAASSTGALPALFLPTVVVPRFFGPWDFSISVDAWLLKWLGGHVSVADCLMYVGLVPLLLAALGRRFRSRGVPARVFVMLGLVSLALALNLAWLWSIGGWLLPPLRVFRSPARFVFLLSLSLCVLASFGATELLEGRVGLGRGRRWLVWSAAVMALAGLAGFVAALWAPHLAQIVPLGATARLIAARQLDVAELTRYVLRSTGGQLLLASGLLLMAVWAITYTTGRQARAWLLLGVTALDLGLFAWPLVTSLERPDRIYAPDLGRLDALGSDGRVLVVDDRVLAGGPNVFLKARRLSTGGYDTFRLRDYDDLMSVAAASAAPQTFWSAMGVRYWIAPMPGTGAPRPEAWSVTELAHPTPRVYWTNRVEIAADRIEALRRIPEVIGGASPAVLLTADQAGRQPRPAPVETEPRLTLLADEPGRQLIRLTTASPGWLVKTEMFYPGWRADVDGVRIDVARVNGVMQGIPLAAGRHEVSFAYAPRSLEYGLAMSALGLIVTTVLLVWSDRAARSDSGREEP